MKVICGIYIIISPSGRVYIGESKDIYNRWFKGYFKFRSCKGQTRLYRSFIKYGVTNHIFQIIEECSFENLKQRERFWQDFYDVCSYKGLNCKLTKTDEKKQELSQITKNKISKSRLGKKLSEETMVKIRALADKKRGIPRTEEVKANMRAGRIGIKFTQEHIDNIRKSRDAVERKILQYNLDGIFIQEWKSIAAIKIFLKKSGVSGINRSLKDKNLIAFGYMWRYKSEDDFPKQIKAYRYGTYPRHVIQEDLEGNFIKEWNSASEACKILDIDSGGISKCCKGKLKTVNGFKWRWKI